MKPKPNLWEEGPTPLDFQDPSFRLPLTTRTRSSDHDLAGHRNNDPKPFIWRATTADIIEKVQRGRTTLNHQTNAATEH